MGMNQDYLSSISMFNLDEVTSGADTTSPLSDVSYGDEPMQPWTPTGNGSGVFLDTSTQQSLLGGLNKVLDYALKKDAYRYGVPMQQYGVPVTSQQALQAQRKQGNLLFLVLCGVGIWMVARA